MDIFVLHPQILGVLSLFRKELTCATLSILRFDFVALGQLTHINNCSILYEAEIAGNLFVTSH